MRKDAARRRQRCFGRRASAAAAGRTSCIGMGFPPLYGGRMATIVILDLMGGVALLLWGLHMVQSGISRAFGSDLRWLMSKALGNRFSAFGAGLGLTAVLQSSTATGLMTASFAAEGALPLATALAIMLGANVGTTLIVQVAVLQYRGRRSRSLRVRPGGLPLRRQFPHQERRPHCDRPRADAAGLAHPDGRPRAGRGRADRPHPAAIDHRRPRLVHRDRGGADLGRAFERRDGAADHVACVFALHHAAGGARAGPGRELWEARSTRCSRAAGATTRRAIACRSAT